MSEKKTPGGILVRKARFEFLEDFTPHWNPAKPVLSQVFNGLSLLPAYFEPHLVDSIRQALPQITDPALRTEVEGFMGQESQHFIQHRRFNKGVLATGNEDLHAYDRQLEQDYEELGRTHWALKKNALRFFALLLPHLLKHALPGHDPAQVADPAWMQE